jgi:tetratricopeptide (TPR) repeat protein
METGKILNNRRFHIIFIVLLVWACFANSIPADFAFDDSAPSVHGLSLTNLKSLFTAASGALEYLPFRDLTYMVDYSLFGLRPCGFHLSNVLYYILCCLALHAFLTRLFKDVFGLSARAAFLATCLFSVNPVNVEVVAGVSQRKDILMGLFVFLSLWGFSVHKTTGSVKHYLLSVASAAIALMSKSTAIVLPALLLLTDIFYTRGRGDKAWLKLLRVLPHAAITAGLTLLNIRILSEGGLLREPFYTDMPTRISITVRAFHAFLIKPLIPYPLRISNIIDANVRISDPLALWAIAGLAAIAVLCIYSWKRIPVLAYALMFFTVSIAPSLHYAPINYMLPERYLFVPLVAHSMAAGYLLSLLSEKSSLSTRRAALAVFAILIVVSATISIRQNRVWRNDISLAINAVRHNPNDPSVQAYLGRQYFIAERFDEAFQVFNSVKKKHMILPDYDFYHALLAHYKGDDETALRILRFLSSNYNLGFIDEYCLYGRIYESTGRKDKAILYYRKALGSNTNIYAPYYMKRDAIAGLRRLGG